MKATIKLAHDPSQTFQELELTLVGTPNSPWNESKIAVQIGNHKDILFYLDSLCFKFPNEELEFKRLFDIHSIIT